MIKTLSYSITELLPYINWIYFFYAWGLPPWCAKTIEESAEKEIKHPIDEKERIQANSARSLYADVLRLASTLDAKYSVFARFGLFEAWSEDDNIVISHSAKTKIRIPFLRQQIVHKDDIPHLCWADFIAPYGVEGPHRLGLFISCVQQEMETLYQDDEYMHMLVKTFSDRLAEAAAEKMHEAVRKTYWGYAPNENFGAQELFAERYLGRRPAIGYPSLPDQSLMFLLDEVLDCSAIGMQLTSNGMMIPHSSVAGLMFSHPACSHFSIGKIDEEQLQDYSHRRGIPVEKMRKFLAANLMYK